MGLRGQRDKGAGGGRFPARERRGPIPDGMEIQFHEVDAGAGRGIRLSVREVLSQAVGLDPGECPMSPPVWVRQAKGNATR